jgi:hypothetical protein
VRQAFYLLQRILALEAKHHGKRYAVLTTSECDNAHLVILEADGAHFHNDGTMERMVEIIERLEGDEYEARGREWLFSYKRLN